MCVSRGSERAIGRDGYVRTLAVTLTRNAWCSGGESEGVRPTLLVCVLTDRLYSGRVARTFSNRGQCDGEMGRWWRMKFPRIAAGEEAMHSRRAVHSHPREH